MYPKYHIVFGAIFSVLIYYLFQITVFQTILIFLASVLIDFDHYIWFIKRKKDWSLKNAYNFLKDVYKKRKPVLMVFHTVEFLILMGILSFYFNFFIFIFIGILFHSISDLIHLIYKKIIYVREFSLIRYLISDKKRYL